MKRWRLLEKKRNKANKTDNRLKEKAIRDLKIDMMMAFMEIRYKSNKLNRG